MSYPAIYSTDFPIECAHIALKKCEICLVADIPPVNRKGVPITRQSKYNERKTCGDECYRISKQSNFSGPVSMKPTDPIGLWLRGAL